MKNRSLMLVFLLIAFVAHSQKKWDKDLVVHYRTLDKNAELLNKIVITSDTLFYEWVDKKKPEKRKFLMNDTLAGKILDAIKRNKALKFKEGKPKEGSENIFFSYVLKEKKKLVVFDQPIKPGSKQEIFIKEFLEPILVLVFSSELSNFPR